MDLEIAIAQKLQAGGDLVIKKGLMPAAGVLQTATGPVLVKGDIRGGVQVKVGHDLIVKGAVVGDIGQPCRIEAEGDVLIVGEVRYAHISAQNIRVGGEVRNTALTSFEHIHVESDLIDVDIAAGDLSTCRRRARKHQLRLVQRFDKVQVLAKQLARDEVRLHKQCDRTSAGLNFHAAEIVLHERDRIRIDLGKFYRYVADKGEEEVTAALKEFFAKGIIGLLGRTNRAYIAANLAHEKVFVQLIQGLRELVFLARRVDLLNVGVRREREALAALAKQLHNLDRGVAVKGKIYPDTTFKFLPREVDISESGELLAIGQHAELNISSGANTSQRKLIRRSVSGRLQTDSLSAEEFRDVVLQLDGEHVVWGRKDHQAQIAV
jgi:hypothetical protein